MVGPPVALVLLGVLNVVVDDDEAHAVVKHLVVEVRVQPWCPSGSDRQVADLHVESLWSARRASRATLGASEGAAEVPDGADFDPRVRP